MKRKTEHHGKKRLPSSKPGRRIFAPNWRQGVAVFIRVIEQKHPYTKGHSERVQKLVLALGEALGWDMHYLRCASVAALLHDVGKIVVENSTLNNRTVLLTAEQNEELIDHPYTGAQMVAGFFSSEVTLGIAQHHERWDGRLDGPRPGYPLGLKGNEISRIARAIAIADAFDAMTTKRAYSEPLTKEVAVEQLLAEAGGHFDPKMVRVFVHTVVPKI